MRGESLRVLRKALKDAENIIKRQNSEIDKLTRDCKSLSLLIDELQDEIKNLKRLNSFKCGTCAYAKPAKVGRSELYVECTNAEHLKRFCHHENSKVRPRTSPGCKSYKEME